MTADRVVAIDGPAGSGKSTLASGLARTLRLPHLNTGRMYRALAAAALRSGVGVDDERGLVEVTRGLRFTVSPPPDAELLVEGFGDDMLTTLEVEGTVSAVSRHPEVRDLMRRIQRTLGEGGAVIEGRDIGSVVFPDAAVKIFLVAPTPDRVERRADERSAGEDDIAASLRERDRDDARTNPLVPAGDAVILDTGFSGIKDTLDRALDVVRARAPWLAGEVSS
ncbi:MAG: (d)CMP kinase [Actinomycetota bacterium]